MLLRIRWFIMGGLASVAALSYLAAQVRKARQKLTPRALVNSGMKGAADLLDTAAAAVQPDPESRR